MLSRRDMVGKLAAGAAAVCAFGVARTGLASVRSEANGSGQGDPPSGEASPPRVPVVDEGPATTLNAPAPWELLRPLAMGSAVAHGWRVAGLTGVADGSCVLTLQNERGRAQRVHLCRNDGRPQGLIYTERFDLVVMNGGQGDLPTEEGFAQALAQVAHTLAANEGRHHGLTVAMLSQADRLREFSGPADRRLR